MYFVSSAHIKVFLNDLTKGVEIYTHTMSPSPFKKALQSSYLRNDLKGLK